MKDNLNRQLIDVLRSERKRQGLSQRALAEKAGWATSFVSKIEQGVGDRHASAYQRYAETLGVELEVSLAAVDS